MHRETPKESIAALCHIKIPYIMLEKKKTSKRHEVWNIEDRVQCPKYSRQRPGEHFAVVVVCYKASPKKQAEQRISSRFIMYVPGIHKLALRSAVSLMFVCVMVIVEVDGCRVLE